MAEEIPLTDAQIAHQDNVQAHEDRVAATAAIDRQTDTLAQQVAAIGSALEMQQKMLDALNATPLPSTTTVTGFSEEGVISLMQAFASAITQAITAGKQP